MPNLDPSLFDDLFAESPPPPAQLALGVYETPAVCHWCGAEVTEAYANPTVPICPVCIPTAPALLDTLEREVVGAEERLVTADERFRQVLAEATVADQQRYHRIQDDIRKSVTDPSLYDKVRGGIAKAIGRHDGLSVILIAMQAYDAAALAVSTDLDCLSVLQSSLLSLAPSKGWTIPDDVAARRERLYREQPTPAEAIATALRQTRIAA